MDASQVRVSCIIIMKKLNYKKGIKCSNDIQIPPTNQATNGPTNVPTTVNTEYIPNCEQDNYSFNPDTDIIGANLEHIITKDRKTCAKACDANRYCKSWVLFDACYLKSGTQKVTKAGILSGIKCTSQQNLCDGICKGDWPFGCATTFSHGYCTPIGGCYYLPLTNNDPNFCCFVNC